MGLIESHNHKFHPSQVAYIAGVNGECTIRLKCDRAIHNPDDPARLAAKLTASGLTVLRAHIVNPRKPGEQHPAFIVEEAIEDVVPSGDGSLVTFQGGRTQQVDIPFKDFESI